MTDAKHSHSSHDASSLDSRFREAVSAIDAGDVAAVERMLREMPSLAVERLESPGAWLRDAVGKALDGFFERPYLLWFVAEDPVRNGKLPANIAAVARTIIDAARRERASTLQPQLDYALSLVSWSWIARESGVQLELIDVLADAGAKLDGNPENALVNRNVAAAEHLVSRGARLTPAAALCLGRWNDAVRLLENATDAEKQYALVLSALHGNAAALRLALAAGADVSKPSAELYSHATPLHHAVSSASLESVQVLVEAGAKITATDSLWDATPLGWAEYGLKQEHGGGESKYAAIVAYLRSRMTSR
jgi:peptide-methionine (S)-S-oxide reductase